MTSSDLRMLTIDRHQLRLYPTAEPGQIETRIRSPVPCGHRELPHRDRSNNCRSKTVTDLSGSSRRVCYLKTLGDRGPILLQFGLPRGKDTISYQRDKLPLTSTQRS